MSAILNREASSLITTKQIKKAGLALTVALSAVISFTTAASASSQYLTSKSHNLFLETKQTSHTTNAYFKDISITIPKGTVFNAGSIGKGVTTGKPYVNINMDNLRWPLRKVVDESKHNQQMTTYIWAKKSLFKIVKQPNYLAYTKTPDNYTQDPYVWEGNKALPSDQFLSKQNAFRVTDDGYLEYFTGITIYTDGNAKPADYAKLQKFVKKGNTSYFYTKAEVSGLPMTKINSTGKYRYRLKMTRTNHYLATVNHSKIQKYGSNAVISVRYNVGGKDFYVGSMTVYP